MQKLDVPELLRRGRELSAEPLEAVLSQASAEHEELFPSDMLHGDSFETRYRQWVDRQLKPKLAAAGDEGAEWWRIATKVDLFDHPELLVQTLTVLAMWFLPGQEGTFATLALLVAIRRLNEKPRHAP